MNERFYLSDDKRLMFETADGANIPISGSPQEFLEFARNHKSAWNAFVDEHDGIASIRMETLQ